MFRRWASITAVMDRMQRCVRMASTGADTIFALATGKGKAGLAVVRISGPAAPAVLQHVTRSPSLPAPRLLSRRKLFDPASGDLLDDALVVHFAAPKSFTGEPVAELHVHGSVAVIRSVLRVLGSDPRLRLAEPGEFARRAFLNNRMDLTQAEGLADLIQAETDAQRRLALSQSGGALSQLYEGWRARLLRAVAHMEAQIDFGESESLPDTQSEVAAEVSALLQDVRTHLNDARRGERLRSGLSVVIAGAPNAGKSSLLNALAQRPAAIVSPVPGTTRDVIEVPLDVAGLPVVLSDTAGIRPSTDPVEAEGVRRSRERLATADVRLLIVDACALLEAARDSAGVAEAVRQHAVDLLGEHAPHAVIATKCDLLPARAADGRARIEGAAAALPWPLLTASCVQTGGVETVLRWLGQDLGRRYDQSAGGNSMPLLTRERHRVHLQRVADALQHCLANASDSVLAAEDLRAALQELGRITGRVDVEHILDVVFRDFCIGK